MPDTPDVAEQVISFAPDLFIIPAAVMLDSKLQPLDSKVYATVYWLERLRDGRCYASNNTIAKVVNSSSSGIRQSLYRLEEQGYIDMTYDDKSHRTGIITLVQMRGGVANETGGVSEMRHKDNKTKGSKFTSETMASIQQVYKAWLVYMVVDPEQRSHATTELRQRLLNAAAKSYRLTPKRQEKIAARLADAGEQTVIRAIKNISHSDFHRGENDRGWKADLLWLLGSYEKVEEWSSKEVE